MFVYFWTKIIYYLINFNNNNILNEHDPDVVEEIEGDGNYFDYQWAPTNTDLV